MGIQGLLPMLKEAQVHGHISDFKGKRLAVDAYVWLHKGAFGCAEELVKGQKTTKFVDYAMHRVRMLRHFGITPYIVFDGGPLPAKKGTEESRAKSRAENLAKVRSLEGQKHNLARDTYTKCVDITPEMAFQFIKALRAEGVDYVVAPYEADAQLCFLEREGYVDGIITEDSDLLVFGCRQVIFKLDHNGQCVSINRDRFNTLNEFPMTGWGDLEFRRMAMLSGCDYLPSIPGIGIKTAHKLLRRYKSFEKLLQSLRLEGGYDIPVNYAKDFAQAERAFIFQRVYDPRLRRLVSLNDLTNAGLSEEDQKWVGLDVHPDIARGMALGDIHPETLKPIEDQWPDFKPLAKVLSRTKSIPVLAQPKVVAGPMDAFIKRTLSDPLPKPIGVRTSGIAKLSEQHLFSSRRAVLSEEPKPAVIAKRSKFFGGKMSAVKELEDAIEAAKEEIVWEKSDAPDIESQGPGTFLPAITRLPSSSSGLESVVGSVVLSPEQLATVKLEEEEDVPDMHLTSPTMSHVSSPIASPPRIRRASTPQTGNADRRSMSRCSSPPISSPVHIDDDPFSPARSTQRDRRLRAVSPGSPCRTGAMAKALIEETQDKEMVEETQLNLETPKHGLSRLTSFASFGSAGSIKTIRSILVPQSSPFGTPTSARATAGSSSRPMSRQAVHGMSSDSIEDDEIVTPSNPPPVRKTVRSRTNKISPVPNATPASRKPLSQPTSSLGKRKSSQSSSDPIEVDEEELEENKKREEKAKIVAAGWKRKYSLDVAFPKPRSTRVNKDASGAMAKWVEERHDPVFSPPPKTKRPVLVSRSSNLPIVAPPDFGATPEDKAAKRRKVDAEEKDVDHTAKIKTTEDAATPVPKVGRFGPGLIRSSLEKFRFTGKVNMEYQD